MNPRFETIPVNRIFLDLENPRHEPYSSDAEAIEYLCRSEQILPLARDIAAVGISPLERFALTPINRTKLGSSGDSYTSLEGNRRLCAIKLLNDPELAPADLRKQFEKIAETWTKISSLPSAIFQSKEAARLWLERLHAGEQGGIGRRRWSPDQITRFSGDRKNKIALALLDYAEAKNLILASERKGRITTAQRYLSNPLVRDAIGLNVENPDNISRSVPEQDFEVYLRKFIDDLKSGHVNSRAKKEDYEAYSRELRKLKGVSGEQIDAEPLSGDLTNRKTKRGPNKKPKKPGHRRHIHFDSEINRKLKELNNYKLSSLYYSACDISLIDHTPLISIGVWAFFETLTVSAGRKLEVSLDSFLSNDKLQNSYKLGSRNEVKPLREALSRISQNGNTTKHHGKSASFNSQQLANDIDTLKDVILRCLEEAIEKKQQG